MPKESKPRAGSLGFAPRKRAKREIPRIRSWPQESKPRLLGFSGYKVGMIQLMARSQSKHGVSRMSIPATIIECPPMKLVGLRGYSKGPYGKSCLDLSQGSIDDLAQKIDEVFAVVETQPGSITGVPRKTPERLEYKIAGDPRSALEYGFQLLGKQIRVCDVFKPGEFVDVIGVTKGKGWQGIIKRWGVSRQPRKHARSSKERHRGASGQRNPSRISWTIPMAGQMGYHTRTEYNKQILLIGDSKLAQRINPKSGFHHYGLIRQDFLVIAGSIPGPARRHIRIRCAIRAPKFREPPQLDFIQYHTELLKLG